MSQKKVAVVLGMHRSGTSAIARGLKALGVDLGDNLMPPAEGNNERGFWEDMDIYRFNERLFSKLGTTWDQMTPLDTNRLSLGEFSAERYEAADLVARKVSTSQVFGFKDPRTSLLLPFWRCIFDDLGIDEHYVIAVRNPLEVSESLRKRDKHETIRGLMLWLKYNWSAVVNSDGRSRVFVTYKNLMLDPTAELARIAAILELGLPRSSSAAMKEYVGEFLSPELVHNRISDNEIRRTENVPDAVRWLYEALLQWSAGEAANEAPADLKTQVENFLTISQPLLQLGDALQRQVKSAEKGRKDLGTSLNQANETLSKHQLRIANLEAAEAAARKEIEGLKGNLNSAASALSEREQRIANLEAAEAAARKEIEGLRQQVSVAFTTIAERDKKLSEAETVISELRANHSEKDKILQTVRSEALEVRANFDNFISKSKQELDQTNSTIGSQKRALVEAQVTISKKDDDIEHLREELKTQKSELQQANARLKALQSIEIDHQRIKANLRNREEAYRQKQEELFGIQKLAADAQECLAMARTELAENVKTVRLLRHEVRALRSSTSWKITKPIRILRALLTRPRQTLNRLIEKSIGARSSPS